MRGIRYSHAGSGCVEVQNILEHIHRDFIGNIHSQTMGSNQVAAVHCKGHEHVLSIFRRQVGKVAHTALILKFIPVADARQRNSIQHQLIEFQAVIVALIFSIPLFIDDAEDLGAVLLTQLPDCRQPVRACIDVRNIKDALHIIGIIRINGVDRLAALANPEITLIPLAHGGAGRGVRALRCDQQRTGKIILVKGCNHPHKLYPAFRGRTGFIKHIVCHLLQLNGAYSHDCSPQLSLEYRHDILACQRDQAAHGQRRRKGDSHVFLPLMFEPVQSIPYHHYK